jgi:hypothetical protein
MDGKLLKERIRELLNEDSGSRFLDDRTSFEFCYEAAIATADALQCLKTSTTITTVANQAGYTLPADFSKLYLRDANKRLFVKYNDGNADSFLFHAPYEEIVYNNNTTGVVNPEKFTIIDYPTLGSNVTGTVTSASDDVGGKSSLIDSGASFTSTVSVGDTVHNTTDASVGYVLAVTSATRLEVALFGGTDNEWDTSDAYIIVPQGRMQLLLDPKPSTAGHTLTVYYLQRPVPVFSDYDTYRFQPQFMTALVKYAAWLYKYRDQEPKFGDAYFLFWERELKKNKAQADDSLNRNSYKVNFKKRR